jgi:universal stress protein A
MLAVEPSDPVIRIRASRRLTAADYRRFEPEFAAELKRRKIPRPCLLLDMRGFKGWTPGGLLRDLKWDLRNRRSFSKIAVVGDAAWHRWITIAGRPLFRAPMKYFGPDETNRAEEWLASAPG